MDLQQLLLVGRATKDAEVLESKEGKTYGKFSMAVNEYRGKDNEEGTSFYNILVFNKTAPNIDKIQKGGMVMIQGRPSVDPYLSKEGEPKASLVVFADKWKKLN